jgi:hypothetical protein
LPRAIPPELIETFFFYGKRRSMISLINSRLGNSSSEGQPSVNPTHSFGWGKILFMQKKVVAARTEKTHRNFSQSQPRQDCQIFIGTIYQNMKNAYTKRKIPNGN